MISFEAIKSMFQDPNQTFEANLLSRKRLCNLEIRILNSARHVVEKRHWNLKFSHVWLVRDRGHFQNFNFLATLHQKNTAIVIRIYTIAHIQSLSSFGPDLVEIFEVAERWVVVDVWVGVSIFYPNGSQSIGVHQLGPNWVWNLT